MAAKSSNVLSVILGGGKGTRLFPLSYERSKPAVPVAGKYRLVDIPISNCINSGMNKIYVLTQFNSASLNRHIKAAYHFDMFSKGFVHILAAEQTPQNTNWMQGTADAVRRNFQHFEKVDFEYLLVLSGDQLYHMDFQEMLDEHVNNNADITIASIPVNAEDATGFGILKKNENNIITEFIEKPSTDLLPDWKSDTGAEKQAEGKHYLASMGIYIFSRQVIFDILNTTDATDFGKEVIPQALGTHKVVSFQHQGYWDDIGTIKSYFEANIGLTDDVPQFNLFDSKHTIYTNPRMLPTTKVMGTVSNNSVIADGCIIHAHSITRSVIGVRSRIGNYTILENVYVLGADYYETIDQIVNAEKSGIPTMGIGKNCLIKNAIIDKNSRIGNNVRLFGSSKLKDCETDLYTVQDGIIVVKKGVVIPDGYVLE